MCPRFCVNHHGFLMVPGDLYSKFVFGLVAVVAKFGLVRHACQSLSILKAPFALQPFLCQSISLCIHCNRYWVIVEYGSQGFPSHLAAFPLYKYFPFSWPLLVLAVSTDGSKIEEVVLVQVLVTPF